MNVLIQLSHPAHFHLYKHVAKNLKEDGHKVFVLIKSKDVLEPLLQEAGLEYYNINEHAHRGSKWGILWDMLSREARMIVFCLRHRIDLLTGSTPEVAHVGWLLRRSSINTGEDDLNIVPMFRKIAGPFLQCLLTPETCNTEPYEDRSVHYPGYHKLAYLHPNRFIANRDVVEKYGIETSKPYFLLRFAKLGAHHDVGVNGISTEVAQHLIDILTPKGKVYITSERELEPQFEQYRLRIHPLDIHHVMNYATLYIGDSQSMAVEAAMLGVPSLRFNDFVGEKKIGVMEELEHKYGLTFGISSKEADRLYDKVNEMLQTEGVREQFQARREVMLKDKIDVTEFLTWFIENYPNSKADVKQSDFNWGRFR
ncbi:MAG: hypothetical protein K5633_01400 [Paludibacteraceae bacterium]|nr:hypothetical protein [Paludibacteraceae bacterium]